MPSWTPTQRLADHILGGTLDEFVRSRRPGRSWRLLARDLYEATGHEIDVTYVTLTSWFPDLVGGEAEVEADAPDEDEDRVQELARSA
jgi:hypothetical protein